MKKFNWKLFITSLLIPLVVGLLATLLTKDSYVGYQGLNLPVFAPPGWLFGVVWPILYVLMGISLYLILSSNKEKKEALWYFGIQLFFNFLWPIVFFNFKLYWLAFVWLLVLIYLIIRMILEFFKINKVSAWLQVPYLVWCVFASVLNIFVAVMN